MTDIPEGFVPLDYPQSRLGWTGSRTRDRANRGDFGPTYRAGTKSPIYVQRERVDEYVRRQAAEQGMAVSQPTEWVTRLGATLYDQIAGAHRTGVGIAAAQTERETILTTMRGDAAEAEQRGDSVIAAEIRLAVEQLEAGEYVFDVQSGRWVFRIETADGYLVPASAQQSA